MDRPATVDHRKRNGVGGAAAMPCDEAEALRRRLAPHGQDHVLRHWAALTGAERAHLASEVRALDCGELGAAYRAAVADAGGRQAGVLEPIPDELHEGVATCTDHQLEQYRKAGLREVGAGRVASLLLAGGQGTRLGVPYPKGMFSVGLPSRKTLYQLQAERLLRLQHLATQLTGNMEASIPWYIMTSEHTMEPTLEFFSSHDYFGLQEEDLVVFEQDMLPCLTLDGKIILETPCKIAKAPDGNGGLFRALRTQGILEDMERRGIKYVHVYCVDNILVKMADPVFIGYCISKGADCAAKVVEKVVPSEAVGVVCRVDGRFQVVEYSEISEEVAGRRNPDGRLTFSAGSICNHFFTVDFLRQIGSGDKKLKHHMAHKKIPYVGDDGKIVIPMKTNGIKLEKFVFDVFVFSDKFAAWEVDREEEFSPLKNSDESAKDTPTTARHSLYAYHRKLVEKAGGRFKGDLSNGSMNGCHGDTKEEGVKEGGVQICEISPLVSYDGEALEELVACKVFSGPVIIRSPCEQISPNTPDTNTRED